MTEPNLVEKFMQQRAEQERQDKAAEEVFLDRRNEKIIELFHGRVAHFIEYMIDNDFPGGYVREFEGDNYISYSLYDVSSGDGEVYYWGTPLHLLIDGNGQPLFICETEPTGYSAYKYHGKSAPEQFDIAHNLTEYKARPSENDLGRERAHMTYGVGTLMTCMSQLEYLVQENERRKASSKPQGIDLYKKENIFNITRELKKEFFPEGYEFREYRQTLLAKQALENQ